MKNKITKIFTLFALIVYLLSIFYLVFNLTYEYKTSSKRNKDRFDSCIMELKSFIPNATAGTNNFNNKLNEIFGDLHDFAYIEFYENGKTLYKYTVTPESENIESKYVKNQFQSFKIDDKNYFLTATLYKLKPYSVYFYLRISFLVILIVTIIAVALIIYSNNKQKEREIPADEEEPDESIEYEDTKIQEEVISKEPVTTEEESNEDTKTVADEIKEKTNEVLFETEKVDLPTKELNPVEIKKDHPEGLFSPTTGLGWEQYLLTRLNSELNRAISSEFDLSLFIIKISNLSRESETVKKVCEYLISSFQFKDLLFEYKEDCIVAIKISMNIDEAITYADTIYKEIENLLSDSFAKCHIGLTSRTLRMISGERLLKEADEALVHAQQAKNSPIMGFRADAEKFRKYFESK